MVTPTAARPCADPDAPTAVAAAEPADPAGPADAAGPAEPAGPEDSATRVAPGEAPLPDERLVLAMAGGPTLREETFRAPLPAHVVARIGIELAAVLAHLHHRGRAHGAVTTANIVLGPGGRAQLVDVDGTGAGRPADDVHDLGLALTTALTGSEAGVVPTDVPRALRRALLAATEADPTRRPTARQMGDMLAWAVRAEPAPEPEPWYSVSRTAAWASGAAALLVVLVALAAVALLRDDPAQTAAPVAPTTAPAVPTASVEPTASDVPTAAPTAAPSAVSTEVLTEVPTAAPTALPTLLPTLPTALPTQLPDLGLPTALPTELPDLPDLPADAQGMWDRFVDWVRSLF